MREVWCRREEEGVEVVSRWEEEEGVVVLEEVEE